MYLNIDFVFYNISSWYLLPQKQTRYVPNLGLDHAYVHNYLKKQCIRNIALLQYFKTEESYSKI